MRNRVTPLITAAGLALVVAGCGGKSPSPPTTPSPPAGSGGNVRTITIPSSDGYGTSSFSPGSATIAVGDTVNWENKDTVAHTSTSDTGVWNSSIGAGGSFSRTFGAAGTFNYRCTLHQGMNGTITVQ